MTDLVREAGLLKVREYVMFDSTAWTVFTVTTALTAVLCVLAAASVIRRSALRRKARRRLDDLEREYRSAFSWPIGPEKGPFPRCARALTLAARKRRWERLAAWMEPTLADVRGMSKRAPRHAIDLCDGIEGLLRSSVDEGSSHEASILEFADGIKDAASFGRRGTLASHETAVALLRDPGYRRFALDAPKLRASMLARALAADEVMCAFDPDLVLQRLLTQSAVITECTLEAVRCTAAWPFLRASWDSVLRRLEMTQEIFHVMTEWSGLLADEGFRPGHGHGDMLVEDLRSVNARLAIVAAVFAGGSEKETASTMDDLFAHCAECHTALSDVEERMRTVMEKLTALSNEDARHTVH